MKSFLRHVASVLLLSLPTLQAVAAVDTVIPMPKSMREVGAPVPLDGFRIVAANEQRAHIGAAELNQRIRSLGGKPLPVIDLQETLPDGRLIVIAPCTARELAAKAAAMKTTPSNPGRQGYVIHAERSGSTVRLYLLGSDTLGTLYAAETCRQLIVRRDGKLMLQGAEVRDWPDYKSRLIGTPFCEPFRGRWYEILSAEKKGDLVKARQIADPWITEQKRYFDWMLRAKINMAWNRVSFTPGDAPEKTTVARAALKQLHQYGLERGIESMCADTTAIGTNPKDKDNPDFRDVVFHRSHHRYFCWSRLEYHRRRAERAARFVAEAGYTGYYLHATDGGGWQNPALWNDRCELCRKTYGNDHARADAIVFGIYHDAIKKRVPNLKFTAVVYPYSGSNIDPDLIYESATATMGEGQPTRELAEQTSRELTTFLQRLNKLLPKDIFVCVRESEREPLDRMRKAWGDRPFLTYFEYAFWKGWRPYFITTPLWTKGLFYPSHDDILFGNVSGNGWQELTQLLAAECAWNVDRPGTRMFDRQAWYATGATQPPPPQRKTFASRACRFMFGDQAGPLLAPAFAENISHYFICFPDQVLDRVDIPDPVEAMAQQTRATARAAESLDRLWERQQEAELLDPLWHAYFLNIYRMTHAAHILANHRQHMLAAQRAIRQGKRKEIEKELVAAATALKQAGPKWETIKQRVQRTQALTWPTRKTSPPGLLMQLDLKELEQEGSALWNHRDELIAQYTIPKWFRDTCRKRQVVAVPTSEEITIDGRLDEPAWASAPRIARFINNRLLQLESLETVARLVYDGKTLYVAFTCYDPDPAGNAVLPSRAKSQRPVDSVDILVATNPMSKQFTRWTVDAQGNVLATHAVLDAKGQPKYVRVVSNGVQARAARGDDRWSIEMAIPAEQLPFRLKAGRSGAILLARNIVHSHPAGETESNAIVFLDGSRFDAVDKFATVRLAAEAEPGEPLEIALHVTPVQFGHETTGNGSGTRFGGDLRVETSRTLHDARITAQYTDGIKLLGKYAFAPVRSIGLMWRPEQPFSMLVPTEVPGVQCTFTLASREGEWTFVRRFGKPRRASIPPEELFVPGIDKQALAHPAFFSAFNPATISIAEGTIEFWFQPNWDVVSRRTGPRGTLAHTLFNLGPIRPNHPQLSNYSSLTLTHTYRGFLSAVIANQHYESRSVSASIRDWKKGAWHHIAFQWKLNDHDKMTMTLYVDGHLAADHCMDKTGSWPAPPLKMNQPRLPIQIGSMNTGFRPAEGAIDELRISEVRRYDAPFVPQKRFHEDNATTALFHFDSDLTATIPPNTIATAGSAQ